MLTAILGPHSSGVGAIAREEDAELHAIATDLIEAVHQKNPVEVAHCLRTMFASLEAEPHEEGPTILSEGE